MAEFIWTDTHFNHTRLVEWGDRPEGFTQILIDAHRSLVGDGDLTYHLGDVIFGQRDPHLANIMSQLKGRHILIRGNHDSMPEAWWQERGFDRVVESISYTRNGVNFLLSHVPIYPQNWIPDFDINIHGHFHLNAHRQADFPWYINWWGRNYLLELDTRLRPEPIDDVLDRALEFYNANY